MDDCLTRLSQEAPLEVAAVVIFFILGITVARSMGTARSPKAVILAKIVKAKEQMMKRPGVSRAFADLVRCFSLCVWFCVLGFVCVGGEGCSRVLECADAQAAWRGADLVCGGS